VQISIPQDAENLARNQAAAAGFANVDDYIANLIRRQPGQNATLPRIRAFQELQKLREELPKLGAEEIVRLVHDARTDLS
jgi:hypothetical protein